MALRDTRRLIALLQKEMTDIATGLCESPAQDLGAYQVQVGRYQGLKRAVSELRKDVDDADDDPL